MYLAQNSRPDIAYAVHQCAIFQVDCYVDADFAGLWNVEPDQDSVCVKFRT